MLINRDKETNCMGIVKKAIESQHRTQTLCVVAIGFSIVAILMVLTIAGGRNAAR